MLERGSPARGLRTGQSRGSEARGVERREAYWLAAARARLRKGTRKKINVKLEAKGDARVLPECQQGTMEESTWADSMDSVCEGKA